MSKKGKKALQEIADEATERYKQESAMQFCECSIHLMATCMPLSAVALFLEQQINILKEYG